jgi:hypothetical protein
MLGKIARQQPAKPVEVSTTLRDALLEHWTEQRDAIRPTLKSQEEEWREFWLHASNAHNWCPRMYALACAFTQDGPGELIKPNTKWLFEQGHAYHDLMQQDALASLPPEVLLGSWSRLVPDEEASKRAGHLVLHREVAEGPQPFGNNDVVRGWQPRPEGDGWKYVEPKVRLHDIRVVVKVDGMLQWPGEPLEVLEIKTEDMVAMDSLNPRLGGVPRPKHVLQCQIGMEGTGAKRARLLYIFKGVKYPKDAMIEHIIERDEGMIRGFRKLASECVAAVESVESAMDAGELDDEGMYNEIDIAYPRLDACPMKSKGRAKYCDCRDLCFPKKKKKK